VKNQKEFLFKFYEFVKRLKMTKEYTLKRKTSGFSFCKNKKAKQQIKLTPVLNTHILKIGIGKGSVWVGDF